MQKIVFMNTLGGNTEILEAMKKLQVSSIHALRGKGHDFGSRFLHNGCDAINQFRPMFEA
jgi:hypothetical protein